jgi:hypothetical protein
MNKEVAEMTGVSPSTVSKYKKMIKTEDERQELPDDQVPDDGGSLLSKRSMKKLYDLQGMFGLESLDGVVDMVWREIIVIMKEKYDFSPEFSKTPSEVFMYFKKRAIEADKLYDDYLHAIYRNHELYPFEMYFDFECSYAEFSKELALQYVKERKWGPPKTLHRNPFIRPEDRAKVEKAIKDGTSLSMN